MYAQLGNIRFEGLKGFDAFSGTKASNYAEHALIEGKPRLQRLGTNLEELTISVALHSAFCDPETEIDDLDQAREIGDVLPLVLGNGVYVGDYVLQSIQRSVEKTDRDGNLVSVVLQLQLREFYDPNKLESLERAAQKRGFANTAGGAQVRITTPQKPSDGMDAAQTVRAVQLQASAVNNDVVEAGANPANRDFLSARITDKLHNITDGADRMLVQITNPQLVPSSGSIGPALNTVKTAANNFLAVLPITSMSSVRTMNTSLQLAVSGLRGASQKLFNQVAIRRV